MLPLSIEYHTAKLGGFNMMVVATLVGFVAMGCRVQMNSDVGYALRMGAFALLAVLSYRHLLVDSAPDKLHNHAIRASKLRAAVWLYVQEFQVLAIIVAAAGVQGLVTKGQRDNAICLCIGAAVMLVLIPVQRALHDEEASAKFVGSTVVGVCAVVGLAVTPVPPSLLAAGLALIFTGLALVDVYVQKHAEQPQETKGLLQPL
jgi:low temperature requirement protein LtrA